jgi:hypothetical protein
MSIVPKQTEAQTCTALCYAQTAAELAAGVTPTHYSYLPLNVLRYGADPTKTVASDPAFAAAYAVCAKMPTGGRIHAPAGQYLSTTPVGPGDAQNTFLEGDGLEVTILFASAGNASSVLSFGVAGTQCHGFEKLSINCAASRSCTGFTLTDVSTFYANDFLIQAAVIGISMANGDGIFINNFVINSSIEVGVNIVSGSDQYFVNGVLFNPSGSPTTVAGIVINGDNGGIFAENLDVIQQGQGLLVNPSNEQSCAFSSFVNCDFDTCQANGVTLAPTAGGSIFGFEFSSCWTSSSTVGSGFGIAGAGAVNGITVNGHRAFHNAQHGFVVLNTAATNLAFNNCDASGNSASSSGSFDGFFFAAGVSGFSVRDSRIGLENNQAYTQGTGIQVAAGASNNYQIIGNDVRGNVTAAISDGGTGTTKMVKDNLGFNPTGSVSITVTASPFSFTNNTGAPISVIVIGGTVLQITVETQDTGVTAEQFIVPQGASIKVTYVAMPTMVTFGL